MEQLLTITTPAGEVCIAATECAVTRIWFGRDLRRRMPGALVACSRSTAPPLLVEAARQIDAYFAGTLRHFTLPLQPIGTPFQLAVWEALQCIPYGQTRSYKQIAEQIGRPRACRAVGMANNRNPIGIVIPCHRVVGHGGALVGYAAGLEVKQRLLELEREV